MISVLGDESKKETFVPYRDSKLTRLLQVLLLLEEEEDVAGVGVLPFR